ncbi:MAG TPA: NUDIX hydrolase [Chloroflexota bacterium]|nr:NUDIX hydrolase [Chloroflexota bacterium]
MDASLARFLTRHTAVVEKAVDWGDMPLQVASYITCETPPLEYVTSVRALVLREDAVLVLHDDGGRHLILPGGRREQGESVDDTLAREVAEETGCLLAHGTQLGFMHFHHLAPRPDGYRYPYPDFLQLVFTARPTGHRPDRIVDDGSVRWSGFMPVDTVLGLPLSPNERVFLETALDSRP